MRLDLDADLFDAKQEEGDEELGRDDRPVVPRLAERLRERWGDMGRYGEIWGDVGRYGEMWGDVGEVAPAGAERRGAQRGRPIEIRGDSGETRGMVRSLPGAAPHLGSISARVQQDVTG